MSTQRILIVEPIFCPTQAMYERNSNSIKSLGEYIKQNNVSNVECQFGGWATPEYWPKILVDIKQYFPNHEITSFKNNVGKAVAVNFLVKKHLKSHHDWIISSDSDIIFSNDVPDRFNRMINLASLMAAYKKMPVGMIAFNQQGQNCHLPHEVYQNKYPVKSNVNGKIYEELACWGSVAGGIAGGCIFISRKAWEMVGGYRVMGCYAGDDAYLLLDIAAKGYSWQMADTIPITHPHQHDDDYANWKRLVCQRDSGQNRPDITAQIKEAEEFWSKRK